MNVLKLFNKKKPEHYNYNEAYLRNGYNISSLLPHGRH